MSFEGSGVTSWRQASSSQGPSIRSAAELAALLESQKGRCAICDENLELADVVPHTRGDALAALHARCSRLVGMAEAMGPEGVERLRAYLWPDRMGAGRE